MERKEFIKTIMKYTSSIFEKGKFKDEFEYNIKILSRSYITYVKEISKEWRI